MAACVTCGREDHWKSLQAGHFIPGRTLSILFDERNCHAQCYGCNVGRYGNLAEYWPYMEDRYGREVIDELRVLKGQVRKYSTQEYQDLILSLKEKIDCLDRLD